LSLSTRRSRPAYGLGGAGQHTLKRRSRAASTQANKPGNNHSTITPQQQQVEIRAT